MSEKPEAPVDAVARASRPVASRSGRPRGGEGVVAGDPRSGTSSRPDRVREGAAGSGRPQQADIPRRAPGALVLCLSLLSPAPTLAQDDQMDVVVLVDLRQSAVSEIPQVTLEVEGHPAVQQTPTDDGQQAGDVAGNGIAVARFKLRKSEAVMLELGSGDGASLKQRLVMPSDASVGVKLRPLLEGGGWSAETLPGSRIASGDDEDWAGEVRPRLSTQEKVAPPAPVSSTGWWIWSLLWLGVFGGLALWARPREGLPAGRYLPGAGAVSSPARAPSMSVRTFSPMEIRRAELLKSEADVPVSSDLVLVPGDWRQVMTSRGETSTHAARIAAVLGGRHGIPALLVSSEGFAPDRALMGHFNMETAPGILRGLVSISTDPNPSELESWVREQAHRDGVVAVVVDAHARPDDSAELRQLVEKAVAESDARLYGVTVMAFGPVA